MEYVEIYVDSEAVPIIHCARPSVGLSVRPCVGMS